MSNCGCIVPTVCMYVCNDIICIIMYVVCVPVMVMLYRFCCMYVCILAPVRKNSFAKHWS